MVRDKSLPILRRVVGPLDLDRRALGKPRETQGNLGKQEKDL